MNTWSILPKDIFESILVSFTFSKCYSLRIVCKEWKSKIDALENKRDFSLLFGLPCFVRGWKEAAAIGSFIRSNRINSFQKIISPMSNSVGEIDLFGSPLSEYVVAWDSQNIFVIKSNYDKTIELVHHEKNATLWNGKSHIEWMEEGKRCCTFVTPLDDTKNRYICVFEFYPIFRYWKVSFKWRVFVEIKPSISSIILIFHQSKARILVHVKEEDSENENFPIRSIKGDWSTGRIICQENKAWLVYSKKVQEIILSTEKEKREWINGKEYPIDISFNHFIHSSCFQSLPYLCMLNGTVASLIFFTIGKTLSFKEPIDKYTRFIFSKENLFILKHRIFFHVEIRLETNDPIVITTKEHHRNRICYNDLIFCIDHFIDQPSPVVCRDKETDAIIHSGLFGDNTCLSAYGLIGSNGSQLVSFVGL